MPGSQPVSPLPPPGRRLTIAARRIAGLSGLTTLILEEARHAVAAGWDVEIIGEALAADQILGVGARPRRVRMLPNPFVAQRRRFPRTVARMVRPGRRGQRTQPGIEIVHGHGDLLDQTVLSLHNCVHAAYEAMHGRPLSGSGPASRLADLHARQLLERRFEVVIANSHLMRDDLIQRFGVPDERIHVVRPGLDPTRFNDDPAARAECRGALRARLSLAPDDTLLGLVTSGDFAKRGVRRAIAALVTLRDVHDLTPHLVVVGRERRVEAYRRLAAQWGVASHVHFLDVDATPERTYRALDLFVYPAVIEEFGMVVQEAMACGVPVIAGRRVGATELFPRGMEDALFASLEPEALAAGIARLLGDPARRGAIAAAQARAAASNSWERHAAAVLRVYDGVARDLLPRPGTSVHQMR